MNIIPDGMPTLDAGGHHAGDGKACVMEYVSILAGEEFSAKPRCTNYALASTAILVNDSISDADRHRLVPYIARLVNTRDHSTEVSEAVLAAVREYNRSFKGQCDCCAPMDVARTPFFIGRLDAALAAYDEATGRTDVPELSEVALRELAGAVAA